MTGETGSQEKTSAGPRPDDGVAYLDQALWSQLVNPVDLDAFGAAWLALMAQNIRGVRAGVLVLDEGGDRQMRPVAAWPRGANPTAPVMAAAEAAIAERAPLARAAQLEEGAPKLCQIAHPVVVDGAPVGVAVLEMDIRPRHEITMALREMQWGAAWIEKTIRERSIHDAQESLGRVRSALELFAVMLDSHGVEEAAAAFTTELATSLGCDRVAIGAQRPKAMAVMALSHSAQFDKRMNLIHGLTRLMEEASDQNSAIAMPQDREGPLVTREHVAFSEAHGGQAIFSAPFRVNDEKVGVLVLERPGDRPFSDEEIELVMAVAALAGPILDDRMTIERPIASKIGDWAGAELTKLTGPEDVARKLVLAGLAAFLAFCLFAVGTHRVAADTRLEGSVRRAVVAPIDGYVDASSIRPGDRIAAGAVLANLDTSDLRIERLHWLSEKNMASLEYTKAISARERAALGVLSAQIEQADARLALIDLQIERAALRSPFDGVVVSGDLTQRIGGSVGRGEVLFEIAPLDDYRVVINVDERDIDYVQPGQTGRLILASMPSKPAPFIVRSITPVSAAKDGSNVFRVEAELDAPSSLGLLRPGMEGVAKIEIGERRLIWIWTHDIINWIRVTAWRWTP